MRDFKQQWKKQWKTATSGDMLKYHLLRAVKARTENFPSYESRVDLAEAFLLGAFTPISNKNKLEKGGCKPFQAVGNAKYYARYLDNTTDPLLICLETEEEITLYKKLLEDACDRLYQKLDEWYTYIFVRTDISISQIIVQASHATWKAKDKIDFKGLGVKNPDEVNFVVCGVEDLDHLDKMSDYLTKNGFLLTSFCEPDLNNEITAFVTHPVPYNRRGVARMFPLLQVQYLDEDQMIAMTLARAPEPVVMCPGNVVHDGVTCQYPHKL